MYKTEKEKKEYSKGFQHGYSFARLELPSKVFIWTFVIGTLFGYTLNYLKNG